MAAGDHDPSRRAVLGAAAGWPLLPCHPELVSGSNSPAPGQVTSWTLKRVQGDDAWQTALAAFRAAEAAVGEIEAATAGYSLEEEEEEEEEEALLPAHEAACEAMEIALGRLLPVPVPHLAALGVKFEAAFAHELASAPDDDLRFRALLQDIILLHSAQGSPPRWLRMSGNEGRALL
jgi:hypothetical protein